MQFITETKDKTQALGKRLAKQLRPGDVVLLSGELGAGKSEMARGIARGLGVEGPVPSPTFTLLNIYQTGSTALHHFDWYREEDQEALMAAGLEEYIQGDWISLIEWHERALGLCPARHLLIDIEVTGEHTRLISISPQGGFRTIVMGEEDLDDSGA